MKVFIAIFVVTLAVSTIGSYVPNAGWNSWNSWNDHSLIGNSYAQSWAPQISAYPYAKSWSSAWPAASLYNDWNGYHGGVNKIQSWGLPLESYGSGWRYQNLAKVAAPVTVNSWGLPWGSYGTGAYGWGHHQGLIKTVVPVSKQIAATPGSIHVAPVPVDVEKVIVH
ncbi:uncharacterized protein LOC131428023 [Malaya genurostris]|uniref:uncharacterized protein LOC131428023 n=1 Tax=Malaya genurostris TaxID=325434 RepID=UPI0026F3EFFD|nr:uncharacterized protein LOC131428023 [Malaya genurostris]